MKCQFCHCDCDGWFLIDDNPCCCFCFFEALEGRVVIKQKFNWMKEGF